MTEKALVAVIQEAWIGGVSTGGSTTWSRRWDSPASRSRRSPSSARTSRAGQRLPGSAAEGEWPYLWLDATYLKQREGGRIISVAAIIAVAVSTDGRREIVGLKVGLSEAEVFWSGFLKTLVRRGLKGVKLVVSDAHEGLKQAIARALGAAWQRCRVHWMRNALAYVPKGDCQEFRVRAMTKGRKEPSHGTTQSAGDPGRDLGPAAGGP